MKKIFALLLALTMVTTLAACGKDTAVGVIGGADGPTDIIVTDGKDEPKDAPKEETEPAADPDLQYVLDNGKMVIGYTVYEPMNYEDAEGNFTGFDTEFARAVCEKLGVEPEFVEIEWSTKVIAIDAKQIDCIWNGMTITDELKQNIAISNPYVKNMQVVIAPKSSGITSTADLIGKTIVAEAGSAGESAIADNADLSQADLITLLKQTDALIEVKAGTAAAAVLDWTLAKSMVGEGTDFADLEIVNGLELSVEEYGIGFRKDSDLCNRVNEIIAELIEDGTLPTLAEKYGLSLAAE